MRISRSALAAARVSRRVSTQSIGVAEAAGSQQPAERDPAERREHLLLRASRSAAA